MRHDEGKHATEELTQELIDQAKRLIGSPYHKHIQELLALIKGKTVVFSAGGNSGYILRFSDGSWVVCYVADSKMAWRYGTGSIDDSVLTLIHNKEVLDGRSPLPEKVPYRDEECDIGKEVQKAHGMVVESYKVAMDEDHFDICFPDGWSLESHFVKRDGKIVFRIFWEKW